MMNAGIIILEDGSPCLVYDETQEGVIKKTELSHADKQMTLVFEIEPPADKDDPFLARVRTGIQKLSRIARKQGPLEKRVKLDYPVEERFFKFLEKTKAIGIAVVQDGKMVSVRIVPVVFTTT